MNEDSMTTTNSMVRIPAIADVLTEGISKLSENGVIILAGIISLTVFSTVCVTCITGSELSIGRGIFEIKQPAMKAS